MSTPGGAEVGRLAADRAAVLRWKRWGPYLADRQWGTVREDYSADGEAWSSLPHDHARSRAYRWGEDGLGGICDRWQHLCFGLALWNGKDPILKERLFGLTNNEGNHGEDVKEHWWPLDSTPTHSYMRWLYRYPQREFPYDELIAVNGQRSRHDREYELADTGVFADNRYFDVTVTYAKATPDDICIVVDCANRGPDTATIHLLPTVWFRNTWSWGRDNRHPWLAATDSDAVEIVHSTLGRFWLAADGHPQWLFTDNVTNSARLWEVASSTPFPKDGINDHVVHGARTVNPAREGTKAAAWYQVTVPPGGTATARLRLADRSLDGGLGPDFSEVLTLRAAEAEEFLDSLTRAPTSPEARHVLRRAVAGLLWTKQFYYYDVKEWSEGDPASPAPPPERLAVRNGAWRHLRNVDIMSMPDSWEYPWYASWDLAFHMIPFAFVDPDFAKEQLVLLCREWFMHPSGQLPAYEWNFDDVNPPVHAWAAYRVFKIDAKNSGRPDYAFLERIFHKLLINFTWWINRKDVEGNNVFEGGFMGLDNIGLFDRSRPLPGGAHVEQSDATSWMAMYCLNMLSIAFELAVHDRTYEDVATKFFEHYLRIADAMNSLGSDHIALWDDDDGFYYDILHSNGGQARLRVRSAVGLIPLFALATLEPELLDQLPDFSARMRWFVKNQPDLCENVFGVDGSGENGRLLLSVLSPDQLRRVLVHMLDEEEFLSPYGVRSLSRHHRDHPVGVDVAGEWHEVNYEPSESTTGLFGGNSNWRGPVWFPINYLLVESLQRYHHFFGDRFLVEIPTGSGRRCNLGGAADELSRRLISLFLPHPEGMRPANRDNGPFDEVTFYEYFDGDTGRGLGASHQTGWTALVAKLIRQSGG